MEQDVGENIIVTINVFNSCNCFVPVSGREGLRHHIRRQTITSLTSTFPGAIFHCEDKQASSLRIFCPVLYHSAISKTFLDKDVFEIITSSKRTGA